MTDGLVAIGANRGDPAAAFAAAVELMTGEPEIELVAVSDAWRTAAVGGPAGQDEFLNAAIRIRTSLPPETVHARLMQIEERLGRRRVARWGPREIDLDLILFGDEVRQTPSLSLPHPRMSFRRFVLEPAAQVASDLQDPLSGLTMGDYQLRLDQWPHVIVLNPAGSRADLLLQALAEQGPGRAFVEAARSRDAGVAQEWLRELTQQIAETGIRDVLLWTSDLPHVMSISQGTNANEAGEASSVADPPVEFTEVLAETATTTGEQARFLVVDALTFLTKLPEHVGCQLRVDRGPDEEQWLTAAQWSARAAGLREIELQSAQDRFRGAYLDLSGAPLDKAVTELSAAIEAMR